MAEDTETKDEKYSQCVCDEMRERVFKKIEQFQTHLKELQLLEELHHFGELCEFDRDFVENKLDLWLNYSTSLDMNHYIEERLIQLPFEQAYCYKNPEFYTKSRTEILQHIFNDSVEWRFNPSVARGMSLEGKGRIIKRFEYMCCYVINTREELFFDLCDILRK
jgi:hypothetical protein